MTTPTCPKCRRVISGDDINVANDVAYCRPCNLSHKLSELTQRAELDAGVDLSQPPAGTWRHNDGSGMVIGASHRSLGAAMGTLAVALFWNGIVSVFVLFNTASTLQLVSGGVPEWFPAPRMGNSGMGIGMTIFLWLFLTPFIVIGLAMIGAFLSSLAGRTELRVTNLESTLFTGIGSLGWRRRFTLQEIKDVRIEERRWRDSDGDRRHKVAIVIETRAGKSIKFGSSLTEERRKFLAAAVRQALLR